jgi:hypothetical protein
MSLCRRCSCWIDTCKSQDSMGKFGTGVWGGKGVNTRLMAEERPAELYDFLPQSPGIYRQHALSSDLWRMRKRSQDWYSILAESENERFGPFPTFMRPGATWLYIAGAFLGDQRAREIGVLNWRLPPLFAVPVLLLGAQINTYNAKFQKLPTPSSRFSSCLTPIGVVIICDETITSRGTTLLCW